MTDEIIIAITFIVSTLIQLEVKQIKLDKFFEERDKQIRNSLRPVNKGVQVNWDEFLKIWNNEE